MVFWVLPEVGGSIPEARGGCACASIGSRVVFFGGADRMTHAYSDVWVLETANGAYQWTQMATTCDEGLTLHPRSGSTLTAIGTNLYLYGGQDISSGMCHGDILCLNATTWHWSRVEVTAGQQPMPRHSHCAGQLAGHCLLIFGGAGETGQMNDVWVFNTEQRGWTCPAITSEKPSAREMHSGTMVDSTTMLVYGGRGSNGRVYDDVAVLDAREMRWRCMEPTPFARCAHSAVLMPRQEVLAGQAQAGDVGQRPADEPMAMDTDGGSVVIIYGGFSGETVEGDVFYIDPVTTEIEVIRRGPRPSDSRGIQLPVPRFAHNAATAPSRDRSFTQEMLVFGGVNPADDLNDLAVLRCGEEVAGVAALEQGVVIEEISTTEGHKLNTTSNTIQHAEGLVELQISEPS